jgi:ribonuclease Z
MAASFHTTLVNGRFGDPALYVRCVWERRALLFDLGQIMHLRPGEILKVSDVFVSHTHVDHFIGFDHLLRVMLNRDRTVRLFGPKGLIANVAGKLAGYTWNLVDDYRLRLQVHEVDADTVRRVTFTCRDRFRNRSRAVVAPFHGTLIDDGRFRVCARLLEHSVPCLGFSLREKVRLSINRDELNRRGWGAGPWLGRLKEAVRKGKALTGGILVPLGGEGKGRRVRVSLEEAASSLVLRTPGTAIAYVTDVKYTAANRDKAVDLARGADLFFCEAAFLQRDADHARRKHHLTAAQAGELARAAGAARLEIFHFSPKYLDEEDLLLREALAAHHGTAAVDSDSAVP